jgi:phosphoglycolate phosphatase
MKTLLLFDIDGTLLRAEDATHKAIDMSFHEIFGTEAATNDITFLGRTDPELFQEASIKLRGRRLDDGEYDSLVARYLKLLPGELKQCAFRLMPGVIQLLSNLSSRTDVILGLETGNIEPAAYFKLKRGNIDHYFSFGGFGSDNKDRTELVRIGIQRARSLNHSVISNDDIYVIGDSPHDISAGRNLSVKTIAVGTGLVAKEKLLAEKPSFYLKDLSDIPAFLQCIRCE